MWKREGYCLTWTSAGKAPLLFGRDWPKWVCLMTFSEKYYCFLRQYVLVFIDLLDYFSLHRKNLSGLPWSFCKVPPALDRYTIHTYNFFNMIIMPIVKCMQFPSRKCLSRHSSVPVGVVQFHQQNYAQLHHCAQLENMLNFCALRRSVWSKRSCLKTFWEKYYLHHRVF